MKKQDSNSEIQQQPNLEQKIAFVDYEEILRQQDLVPIRPLGRGAFGSVYEAYDRKFGIVAVKIIKKEKFDIRELEASEIIHKEVSWCPFIMDHKQNKLNNSYQILILEYSNMNTLNIIAKQSQFSLPSCILRALMNQILEGMRVFHSADLVHRDIKCDNILLHSPPGSGLVYAKISDFGFAKKVDLTNKQTQQAGTVPFMSPEQFLDNPIITKKVDIYALGITFYKLITHKYPVNERNFKEQRKKMSQLKCIKRPSEIKDNLLWDLLSNMLEFDPNKRFSAAQALKHPYFTSPEALADISKEQEKLTNQVQSQYYSGNNKYDSIPSFIFPASELKKFLPIEDPHKKGKSLHWLSSQLQQNQNQQKIEEKQENEEEINNELQLIVEDLNLQEIENNDDQIKQKCESSSQQQIEVKQQSDKDQTYISPNEKQLQSISQLQIISQEYQFSDLQDQSQIQQSSSQSQSLIIQQDSQLPQLNFSDSIYSHHFRSFGNPTCIQNQLQASKEQLQAEKDLIEMNMSFEEIKEKLDKFESLSKLQIDVICSILDKQLIHNFNNQTITIQVGVINSLIQMLMNLSLIEIYPIYIHPLLSQTTYCNKNIWKQLLQMNLLKLVNQLLNCENELIIAQILKLVQEIIFEFDKEIDEGKPNQLLKDMEKDGILTKLIEIFRNDKYENEYIQFQVICSIEYFFKANLVSLLNKSLIIIHLKDIILNTNSVIASYFLISII